MLLMIYPREIVSRTRVTAKYHRLDVPLYLAYETGIRPQSAGIYWRLKRLEVTFQQRNSRNCKSASFPVCDDKVIPSTQTDNRKAGKISIDSIRSSERRDLRFIEQN